MKILHTDKDERPALVLDAEKFLQENAKVNKPHSANDVVIDLSTGNPMAAEKPAKKNNGTIWAIIIILVLLIVTGLVYYFKLKAQKENEYSGN